MLIKGPGSPTLSDKLIDEYDLNQVEVRSKIFPDGEIYISLEGEVEGEDCYLVHTTYPNKRLIELFFLQDALVENGARSVNVIVPYYSYGRQDKRFEKGEAISARAIAKRIEVQADSFYSIDLHSKDIIDFFDIPSYNLTSMRLLAEHSMKFEPDILISPDEGGVERIKRAATEVELKWDYLEKIRISSDSVEIKPKSIDVSGKNVVILDDIISTGGTMTEAAKQLKEQGAERVYAGCTHGLFVEDAMDRLDNVCDRIFCTDTIECEKSEVSVSPLLEDVVK
ncbi:MAG: ribose-phosphate diphosphokinase [Thermoplasmatota archaeon]